jgi:hypothetical protein
MSSATIIVGCPFENLFQKVNQPVRKFNSDTGEPYMKDNYVLTLCGKIIDYAGEDPDYCPDLYLPGELTFASYANDTRGRMIIGITVRNISDDDGNWVDFATTEIEEAQEKAKQTLTSIGYNGEVKPYLVVLSTY